MQATKYLRTLAATASLAFIALHGSALFAQPLERLPAGSRVQLVVKDSLRQTPLDAARQAFTGTLTRISNDSVWIRPLNASELGVARTSLQAVRISRGRSRAR